MAELIKTWEVSEKRALQLAKSFEMFERMILSNMDRKKILIKLLQTIEKNMAIDFPKNVCSKGCSHCCNVAVGITPLEADYIAEKTGRKIKGYGPKEIDHDTWEPCPFLEDNECSIYEFRPAVCRVFATYDSPDFCADKTFPKHDISSLQPPGGGCSEWANILYFELVSRDMAARNLRDGAKDIREYFDAEN